MPEATRRSRIRSIGTLLDIASLRTAAAAFTSDPAAFVATWPEKQLGYAYAATLLERYQNFDELTERALRFAARGMR